MTRRFFHVVLHEPEIPNNTGNIGRTCIATGCGLHLVKPLGFDTSEKALRRAGLDYWPRVGAIEHETWGAYLVWCGDGGATCHDAEPSADQRRALTGERGGNIAPEHDAAEDGSIVARARRWYFTTKAVRTVWDAELRVGDHLVFGKETRGLPDELLAEQPAESLLALPMMAGERSLNLATAVCAVVYEGLRQGVGRGEIALDGAGRIVR